MKTYVIKDTIINQKTQEKLVFFMGKGKDDHAYNFVEYAKGFVKKANALKKIQNEIKGSLLGRNEKINDHQYLESKLWLHTLELLEIETQN